MFDLNGDGNVDADEFDKVTDLMKQNSSTGMMSVKYFLLKHFLIQELVTEITATTAAHSKESTLD